jgi:hypothetical protein
VGGSTLLVGFHLKLHWEFLFLGFCGHSVRVVVHRGVPYQGVTAHDSVTCPLLLYSFIQLPELSKAGVAQSVQCLTTDWMTRIQSPTEAEDFSSSLCV